MSPKRSARDVLGSGLPGLYLLLLCLLSPGLPALSQDTRWTDSLQKNLAGAGTSRQRVDALLDLSTYYNRIDDKRSNEYGRQAIETAELSRDRPLMVRAYRINGYRFTNTSIFNQIDIALDYFRKAERIAQDNGLTADLVKTYCDLAFACRNKGDNDQALQFSNLALVAALGHETDTVRVQAYISLGDTYLARNEKLLAFRNYLEASNLAEIEKNNELVHDAQASLSGFYASIPDYDKAIDYEMKAIDARQSAPGRGSIAILNDYNGMGALFEKEQKYDLALRMYEHAIALADTMHFELYKVNSYVNIFLMYFKAKQFRKGVDYLGQHPALMETVREAGLQFFIDQAYGAAYSDLNRFDSAAFYFTRAEPEIEKSVGAYAKGSFYEQVGSFYSRKGDIARAIAYYQKARSIGVAVKDISILRNDDGNLDSLYARKGDYQLAHQYNAEYSLYSDSMRSLSRDADVLKLQLDNDARRRERLAREEELNTEHRHNVQYMGFTIGLIVLFLSLTMLGWFVVSPRTIRALGFFSFIFLFEFIILLADKQIHEWTHGEPWKILVIKIGLAAILLPLHHWLEHEVIHYLTSRKKNGKPATV